MAKKPLSFRLLSIRRMPGLPRGLPTIRDFAAHINIIVGPNAAGKSSTARVLRNLIWRQSDGEISAHGVAMLDGLEWELDLDGRRALSRVNGEEAILPGIPAWVGSKRYTLALDDLLAANDGDLAEQVVTASTGYNLLAAEQALGYWLGGIRTNSNLYLGYANAKGEYDRLFALQEALVREQQRLTSLREEKAEAEQAAVALDWYRLLLEYLRSKENADELDAGMKGMPPILAELSGKEYEELAELKKLLERVTRNVEAEEEAISRAQIERTALGFPEGGLAAGLLAELEGRIEAWTELDRKVAESSRELALVLGREREALKLLGAGAESVEWEGVTTIEVDTIEEHLQRFHQWLSRKVAIEAVVAELGRSRSVEALPKPEVLTSGLHSLLGWLQDSRSAIKAQVPAWAVWLLSGLGSVATLVTLVYGQPGLVALLLPAVGVFIAFRLRKKGGRSGTVIRRADYEELGLPAPASWNEADVRERLKDLVDLLGRSNWDQKVDNRVELIREELAAMESEGAGMQERYELLRGELRLLPKLPTGDPRSYDGMFWFVHRAGQWHTLHSERVGWQEKIGTMDIQQDDVLKEINLLFQKASMGPVDDPIEAKILRQRLADGETRWREAGIRIDNSKRNLERFVAEEAAAKVKITGLFANLGLEEGAEEKLRTLAGQVSAYRVVKQQADEARALLSAAEQTLRSHSLFESREGEMHSVNQAVLEAKILELTDRSSGIEAIRDEISQINANIHAAEGGNNLESSLKKMEDSVAALEIEYDRRLRSITGRLLTDALKKESDERDRPAVFKAADALFSRITHGRYRLRLKGSQTPAFTAFETAEGESRELDQLSKGTRIQLLLAVRLAFLDSQEDSVSIPIIADELLANSDPRRSAAIMEALVEISREGRQIFYFTAQEEEVVRWERFLAHKTDISRKETVLAGEEGEVYATGLALPGEEFMRSPLLEGIPDHNGLDHERYGALLDKGHFDPMADSPDWLHVWHLFEDPAGVNALLKRGLTRWGPLQIYRKADGDMGGIDQKLIDLAAQKVAIFTRFLELYRQGRPLRIDRKTLEESGAVSGTFIEAISDRLAEVEYDPVRLLSALERGEVPRFSGRKIAELREYLLAEGYVSEDRILAPEEIWLPLRAFISHTSVSVDEVERMIIRILGSE
jgi:uncharacterized protein YhaN